jgi:transposase
MPVFSRASACRPSWSKSTETISDSPEFGHTYGLAGVSASRNGALAYIPWTSPNNELAWCDLDGRPLGRVPVPPGPYDFAVPSPDGLQIVADRVVTQNRTEVWRLDGVRGIATRLADLPGSNGNALWSPDGRSIMYWSDRNGPGAFYMMDRGYIDFERLYAMHQAGAFFVTRAKAGMDARRVYSTPTDRSTGVICDQRVMLNGFYSAKNYPEHLRRVRFKDPESGKTLVFLTNNTTLPALTIAALYKSRWQVELFFKWIKQHLRIKRFLGTSENAVKTQIWCAVATYVLIAIVKKELHLDASLYTCLQILSVSVFEKTEVSCALQPDRSQPEPPVAPNQLILFDF